MKNIIILLLSYFLGCFNTGYYYVKVFYKKDVRDGGSNAAGAANVGRQVGIKGFFVTFFGDTIKGAAVVILCRLLSIGDVFTLLCILAVVAGHIFPFQLNFSGGKGLSTALGAFLVYDYKIAVYTLATAGVFLPFLKDRNMACLAGLLLLPAEMVAAGYGLNGIMAVAVLDIMIFCAFRKNIKEYILHFKKK